MPTLTLCTLGRFQIERAGAPIPDHAWPTQKSKQLVKLLISAQGDWVPADRILEWLWPDLTPARGRNNLWVAVSQARRVLEPELAPRGRSAYIASAAEGYRWLDGPDQLWDVAQFLQAWETAQRTEEPQARLAALEAAAGYYTGDYLAEDLYEEWALPLRRTLHTHYRTLLGELAESYAAQARYADAIAQMHTRLALEPADETAYQALMRFAYYAGDQRAALHAYEECVRVLRAELDVAPMPSTTELMQQIQRHTLPRPAQAPPIAAAHAAPAAAYSLAQPPFVGRSREFAALTQAVRAAAGGQGQVVLIEGEPGIGKSRLVRETIAFARRLQMRTLVAHCYEVEQTIPYSPVMDLLDQALAETPGHLFLQLPPVYLAELATLTPELGDLLDQPPALPDDTGARQARRLRALQQFLEIVAEGHGLLLAVDDLHWADHATRQFFHHLAAHITRLPILLICTYRAEEAADAELATLIDSISRTLETIRLALNRLDADDTGAFLGLLTGSPAATQRLGAWLHAETDGNPFFLVSILQSLVEQGLLHQAQPVWQMDSPRLEAPDAGLALPDALRESVRVRLRRVPAPMRRVLEVAAVLGRRFDFATLQAVSGEPGLALVETVEALLQRHLLRETSDGNAYDFSHDKVREVVYHDISSARRVLLHRSVAQTLESLEGGSIRERAANLARHFAQGQVWSKAIYYLAQAAARSKELFAVRAAVHFYDQALDLARQHADAVDPALVLDLHWQRGGVLALLGGRLQDAVADLRLVLEAAQAAGDRVRQRDTLIALGQVYRMADQLDKAMESLTAALQICRESSDRRSLADVLYHLGTVAWSAGNNLQASIYHQEAADLSRQLPEPDLITVQALHGRGEAFVAAARPNYAFELFEESLAIARKIGDRRYEGENLQMIGWSCVGLFGIADYAHAEERLTASLAVSRDAQVDWNAGITACLLGWVRACRGDYGQGLALVRQAIEELAAAGLVRYLSMAYDMLGYIYQDLNLDQEALAAHSQGLQIGIEANVGFWLPRLCADVAIDRVRLGESNAAHDLEVALSLTIEEYQRFHAVRALEGLMEDGVRRGLPERTLHFAAALESISRAGGLREQQCHVHRWRGAAYRLQGELARAGQELAEALTLAESIGRVRLLWDVHAEWARLACAQGDRALAAAHEDAGLILARRMAENLPDPALAAGLPLAAAADLTEAV